ncbi:unnamed protein product [Symbiodinium natans]|uniref:Uncharacterized protein n=1 Tax=Symbiodinium natans TaxID=878477 RepID=A0A812K4C9_9DINO|nr:unnamed protein product [Symbiodinium natans]
MRVASFPMRILVLLSSLPLVTSSNSSCSYEPAKEDHVGQVWFEIFGNGSFIHSQGDPDMNEVNFLQMGVASFAQPGNNPFILARTLARGTCVLPPHSPLISSTHRRHAPDASSIIFIVRSR